MKAMLFKRPLSLVLCLLTGYCLWYMYILLGQLSTGTKQLSPFAERVRGEYLLDTPGCKIPNFNPFDDSIRDYIWEYPPLRCDNNEKTTLTFQDGPWIRLDVQTIRRRRIDFWYCELATIARHPSNDTMISFSTEKIRFQSDIKVKDEFVKVECFGNSGGLIYVNFHAFILPKPTLQRELRNRFRWYITKYNIKRHLNVLLLGVDSVSRLNSIRHLSKTRKYLLSKLHAVELKGFNKIGDNTLPNLVALLSGKFYTELSLDRNVLRKTFDEYDLMWKHFSSMGFQTFLAEDSALQAIFNCCNMKGFSRPPTNYYFRPFSLAIHQHGSGWANDHDCFNGRPEIEIVLDWLNDFMRFRKDNPYFALTFLSQISHDHINKVGSVDEIYLNFLQHLQSSGYLDNTVLIFFGDHGLRFGSFRSTYIGKLEDRLPMMYISLPEWFKTEHRVISQNLQSNSDRLTTFFDIHETLKDILYMNNIGGKVSDEPRRGLSLFGKISPERTCNDAAIHPHWCSCYSEEDIPTETEIIRSVVNVAVEYLNKLTSQARSNCADLELATIHKALRLLSERALIEKSLDFVDYQITFTTIPGDGRFEATIRHFVKTDRFTVAGDISRTNRYGNQSQCIDDFFLKKYCFCI